MGSDAWVADAIESAEFIAKRRAQLRVSPIPMRPPAPGASACPYFPNHDCGPRCNGEGWCLLVDGPFTPAKEER